MANILSNSLWQKCLSRVRGNNVHLWLDLAACGGCFYQNGNFWCGLAACGGLFYENGHFWRGLAASGGFLSSKLSFFMGSGGFRRPFIIKVVISGAVWQPPAVFVVKVVISGAVSRPPAVFVCSWLFPGGSGGLRRFLVISGRL